MIEDKEFTVIWHVGGAEAYQKTVLLPYSTIKNEEIRDMSVITQEERNEPNTTYKN